MFQPRYCVWYEVRIAKVCSGRQKPLVRKFAQQVDAGAWASFWPLARFGKNIDALDFFDEYVLTGFLYQNKCFALYKNISHAAPLATRKYCPQSGDPRCQGQMGTGFPEPKRRPPM